jgi:hypothetical protein
MVADRGRADMREKEWAEVWQRRFAPLRMIWTEIEIVNSFDHRTLVQICIHFCFDRNRNSDSFRFR